MSKYINSDLPSSIVAYFVALLLCLGIAFTSGAPLFFGLIAGFIGAIVVGRLSGSTLDLIAIAAVFRQTEIWIIAFILTLVDSFETLLSVEAKDKLDPQKRVAPAHRELVAQDAGNIASRLIGGLPITQMIVLCSANVHSKAKSKLSVIFHGFLIIISLILIFKSLNMIPLYGLATVLLLEGKSYQKSHFLHKLDFNRNSA